CRSESLNAATAPFSPEHLRARIANLPDDPPDLNSPPREAGRVVDTLRQQSTLPVGVVADPLADPGGSAGEGAWQDHPRALRHQIKVLLAGSKLHAGLIVAALSSSEEPLDPSDASQKAGSTPGEAAVARVTRYEERATAWIEATTRELERHWAGADAAPGLSEYHRYEIARTLVSMLQHQPDGVNRTDPAVMAACLAAPSQTLPAAPPVPEWVSAGAAADVHMAWSRTLARVLETAVKTPFNRDLDVLLIDARTAIASAVERQIQSLPAGALDRAPDVQRIVELHALKIAGRLYAATLAHVYDESTRMIQRYQRLREHGQEEEADQLARIYQDRQLGYVGVPHYFEEIIALHERQQQAARAIISTSTSASSAVSSPSLESEKTAPAPGVRANAARAVAPTHNS
ncbi:MAG: hypothetical protein LM522_05990, partial [Candidatus Contendobacter sp.]|nr:hypothetical protein [Candidatus Contendobacter sp.]